MMEDIQKVGKNMQQKSMTETAAYTPVMRSQDFDREIKNPSILRKIVSVRPKF